MTLRDLLLVLAALAAGYSAGWHDGFEAGIHEERAAACERSECACLGDCCADHPRPRSPR